MFILEQQLQTIREKALAQLAEAQDTAALEQLRVSVLGKKGELTGILRGMESQGMILSLIHI